MPPENVCVMEVEAETLKVRVGNLTIEADPQDGSKVATAYGSTILFDGKEPPLGIRRIELTADVDDGPWRVTLYGFVKGG